MHDLALNILELIRITSTDLPAPVEERLREAQANEQTGTAAHEALHAILANVELARKNSTPICQDTGVPAFFVHYPAELKPGDITHHIRNATALATQNAYLRPNAVDALSGNNTGNNLGDENFPIIHFTPIEGNILTIDLILKGGGCENVGAQYSLPDTRLHADRNLEGVRKVVLDAVYQAQGQGCAPGFLGVAIGGDRGTSYTVAKQVLLKSLDDENEDKKLMELEGRITKEANELGIGPMGFGGKSTILVTKIASTHRLPASFFVSISYMCWAFRRRKMVVEKDMVTFE